MSGVHGVALSLLWSAFVIGVYSVATYAWIIVLSTIAIARVQRVGYLKAALAASLSFFISISLYSTFVR